MDLEQNAFKDNPMHEDQFDFVKGRSTEHTLSATVNEIGKGLREKELPLFWTSREPWTTLNHQLLSKP
jgi:hypothetical protein